MTKNYAVNIEQNYCDYKFAKNCAALACCTKTAVICVTWKVAFSWHLRFPTVTVFLTITSVTLLWLCPDKDVPGSGCWGHFGQQYSSKLILLLPRLSSPISFFFLVSRCTLSLLWSPSFLFCVVVSLTGLPQSWFFCSVGLLPGHFLSVGTQGLLDLELTLIFLFFGNLNHEENADA